MEIIFFYIPAHVTLFTIGQPKMKSHPFGGIVVVMNLAEI